MPPEADPMTDRVHTCHAECPCQTGGEPMRDFLPVEAVSRIGWAAYLEHLAGSRDRRRALDEEDV